MASNLSTTTISRGDEEPLTPETVAKRRAQDVEADAQHKAKFAPPVTKTPDELVRQARDNGSRSILIARLMAEFVAALELPPDDLEDVADRMIVEHGDTAGTIPDGTPFQSSGYRSAYGVAGLYGNPFLPATRGRRVKREGTGVGDKPIPKREKQRSAARTLQRKADREAARRVKEAEGGEEVTVLRLHEAGMSLSKIGAKLWPGKTKVMQKRTAQKQLDRARKGGGGTVAPAAGP